jgi:hypothetical protein
MHITLSNELIRLVPAFVYRERAYSKEHRGTQKRCHEVSSSRFSGHQADRPFVSEETKASGEDRKYHF